MMLIKTWIKYEESYLPPRCRKLRYHKREEYVNANLREAALSDLQLAFEDHSYSGKGKIYFYRGKLWYKCTIREICSGDESEYATPLAAFIYWKEHSSNYFANHFYDGVHADRATVVKRLRKDMLQYLLVDAELYKTTAEPRYCVLTFGLGHNHGGTGMFCDYHYNPNICKDSYFPATEGETAVAYANKVAARRGDTNDVGKFKPFITVHMPEIVKVRPNGQHGNGNKLLNDMESIIQESSNPAEAAMLCSVFAALEVDH